MSYVIPEGVMSVEMDGQVVLLEIDSGVYYSLDLVGGLIWSMLEKGNSVEEIALQICEEYDVPMDRVESDVQCLLADLRTANLILVK